MRILDRLVLSDAVWQRTAPLIIGLPDQKGSTGPDNHMFFEGVLLIVPTGSTERRFSKLRQFKRVAAR
jgi:putative transposase